MKWEEVRSAFDWDGSWRDLYVLGTTRDDWQRLLDFLRSSGYALRFRHGGDELPLPDNLSGYFSGESEWTTLLSVEVGGVTLNAHFFTPEEVEFDIDPREVQTSERAEVVFDFMRRVGRALGKPIRLTPENMSELVLFEYDPAADVLRKEHEFRALL
jgi:hypothetical protein